jgi:hypothetical protein
VKTSPAAACCREPAVVLDRANRLTVDFENNMAALDVGVEGGAEGLDPRDDHPFEAFREAETLSELAIEIAHRESQGHAPLARRLRLSIVGRAQPTLP